MTQNTVWVVDKNKKVIGVTRVNIGIGNYTAENLQGQSTKVSIGKAKTLLSGSRFYKGKGSNYRKGKYVSKYPSIMLPELENTSLPIYLVACFSGAKAGYTRQRILAKKIAGLGCYVTEAKDTNVPKIGTKDLNCLVWYKGITDKEVFSRMRILNKKNFIHLVEGYMRTKPGKKLDKDSFYFGELTKDTTGSLVRLLERMIPKTRIYKVDMLNASSFLVSYEHTIGNKDVTLQAVYLYNPTTGLVQKSKDSGSFQDSPLNI